MPCDSDKEKGKEKQLISPPKLQKKNPTYLFCRKIKLSMKKEINKCRGSGSQNLQGFHPLPCVLCCLSDLENPGKKERKLNFSHLPSIQTCEITGQDEAPPFILVVVLAGVAVGLGRVSQPLELAYDLALTSEARCRRWSSWCLQEADF